MSPSNKKVVLVLFLLGIILASVIFLYKESNSISKSNGSVYTTIYSVTTTQIIATSNATSSNNVGTSVQSNSTVLFSSSQIYPYSYLIYPGSLSSNAKAALSGFTIMNRTLANGSTELFIEEQRYGINQSITLASNDKLYFIETTFSEDGFGNDGSLSDDGFVVVNSKGYIIQ